MATQVAATYSPDYQCIRLKSVFPALRIRKNLKAFKLHIKLVFLSTSGFIIYTIIQQFME